MKLWLDAQLSPSIAGWISAEFGLDAVAVRDLGLRDAEDAEIFAAAKRASACVITKDRDFIQLLEQFGPPPMVIWLTCSNTSNLRLRQILRVTIGNAVDLIASGETLVEISSPN